MNKRKNSAVGHYFHTGLTFLREHPQLWFTALVAVTICGAFVFVSFRFASIADTAQQKLFNTRAGWLLDGFALFVAESMHDRVVLRTGVEEVLRKNETIETIRIIVPHGNDAWRLYVTPGGEREGTVETLSPALTIGAQLAWARPSVPWTLYQGDGTERRIEMFQSVVDASGNSEALVQLSMRMSEADRVIAAQLQQTMYLLALILIVIMILFFRHARIVDFAVLYKKQLEIDEMKDSFLSMASHELKSPLSVIRGYIEYLRDGNLEEKQRQEFLRRIDLSADELRQLVDDILDVSRIEMGRLRFSPDYIRTIDVLEEVEEMFKVSAEGKGLTLSLSVADEARAASVRVDRGRLKQVMVNLTSNAVKYTLEGAVTIEQSVRDGVVELAVRDSGVGMTAQEQQQLFGKFYRAEAEETKGVRGTGLGLWITKYIIEHMGGTISVESIKGQGSRFVVTFPISAVPVETSDNPRVAPQEKLS